MSPTASTEEIRTSVAELIHEITGIEPERVQLDKTLVEDLDVDSLSMIEVVVGTEQTLGVRIPDEAVKDLRTVADLVGLIERSRTA